MDDPIADPTVEMLGRPHAWDFIGRFAAVWSTPLDEDDGCSDAELDEAEDRLDMPLPVAVREAYRLFGRRRDLTSNQDRLLAPHELEVEDDHRLVYRRECQNCAVWAVDLANATKVDPPTVWREYGGHDWRPFLDRFSDACVEMVLSESLVDGPIELTENGQLDDASLAVLETYRRLNFPSYDLWAAAPAGPPVRWFAAPGVLLCDHAETWLWVRALTPEAIEDVRHRFPSDWIMS
jgi:hypothetical protein